MRPQYTPCQIKIFPGRKKKKKKVSKENAEK